MIADGEDGDAGIRVDSPVEKLALGRTPDDEVTVGEAPARWRVPGVTPLAQVALVRAAFTDDPAGLQLHAREIRQAWQVAGGDRAAFMRETAALRLALLNRAALHATRRHAEQVTADLYAYLDAYLDEIGDGA